MVVGDDQRPVGHGATDLGADLLELLLRAAGQGYRCAFGNRPREILGGQLADEAGGAEDDYIVGARIRTHVRSLAPRVGPAAAQAPTVG